MPSDALSQHLSSYLGFSYLGHRVSLHGCSREMQPLLLTLDEGDLLKAAPPDLESGVAPLGPSVPTQQLLLGAKDGEALGSQQKQDLELTVAQIMNSLLPNSDLN